MFFLFDPAIRVVLSVFAKPVFRFFHGHDAPIPFPASSSLVCQALYDLKGCADDKMLEKDGQSIPAVHKRIWRPGLQIFPDGCILNSVHPAPRNIFGHVLLVQADTNTCLRS